MRCSRKIFLRYLRFLRNLSVEIVRYRWVAGVGQGHPPQSIRSSRLPSLCSTQPHMKGLFDKPLPTPMGRETLVCRESCKSPPESENRVCTHSRLTCSCAKSVMSV